MLFAFGHSTDILKCGKQLMIWQQTRSQLYAMIATKVAYDRALPMPGSLRCADSTVTKAQQCALSNLLLSQLQFETEQ